MAFDFREFFLLADELVGRVDESARRSGVSRAYYALLHAAYAALPPHARATVNPGGVHRTLWNLYAVSSQSASRRIGGVGFRLRDLRVACDYQASAIISSADARTAVSSARRAFDLLDRHGYSP